MAVSAQTPRVVHTGDGTSVAFTYPFPIAQSTDLDVYVGSTLQATSAYTVTGAGNPAGGTVTFVTAPASGASVVLVRDTPVARPVDIAEHGDFRAQTFNYEYDRIYMILQDQSDRASRTLALPSSVVLPTTGKRQVSVDYIGATSLSTYDSDTAYANAAAALTLGTEAKAIAQEALAQTRPELGAQLSVYTHALVAGTSTYQCAPSGLPAPAAANVIVHYDGTMLVPDVDYTLDVDGLSIVLAGDVVATAPESDEFAAGLSLVCVKIAGGLITADISPETIGTTELKPKAVTTAIEADGTPKSVRTYDVDGRPADVTGASGKYLQFDATGPIAGDGPAVASEAEVRAGTSTTKFVTPATAAYAPNAPLFVARWANATVNGAMNLTWMRTTITGPVALTRTAQGKYRLTHPAMTAAPVVTFIAPTASTAPLRARVFPESSTATVIESWSGDSPEDAGVVVTMYGSLN